MDPQSQFPQAPASPVAAPGIPGGNDSGLSQDEMRTNLQGMMGKLTSKYEDLGAAQNLRGESEGDAKGQLLQKIFDYFESVGVDPSNPEEVSKYLEELKNENPELSQQLEQLLQEAMGSDEEGLDTGDPSQDEEEPSEGFDSSSMLGNMNMNQDETVSQDL